MKTVDIAQRVRPTTAPALPVDAPLPFVASEKELLAATPPGEQPKVPTVAPVLTPQPEADDEPEPAQAAPRAAKQKPKGKHGGMRRPDGKEWRRFTVSVDPAVFEDLRTYAFTSRSSMSGVVEAALRTFLRRRKTAVVLTDEERDALDIAIREGVTLT